MAESPKIAEILMDEEKPIDLRYYLNLFRKRIPIIVTFVIIAVTISGIYSFKQPTLYQTSAKMILERPRTTWQESGEGSNFYRPGQDELTNTYFNTQKEIMLGSTVLGLVAEGLKLETYFETKDRDALINQLRAMIHIESPKDSRLVVVTVTAQDPKLAARIANAVGESFIQKSFEDRLYYSKDMLSWLEQGTPGEHITITDAHGQVKRVRYEKLVESLPAIQTDPNLRAFRNQLQETKIELDNLLRKFRDKHPLVIKTRANLAFVEDNMVREKQNIISNLKSKARGELEGKPGRIVEEAKVPTTPIQSERYRFIIICTLAAIFLALAIIFALDHFDDTIHIMEDFERKGILIPFLGPLPLMSALLRTKTRVPVLTHMHEDEDRVAVEEAFRYLRVAINFSAPPETVKTLAIASCLPGDGKSFVSTNLASSLALDGNRVLLIDGDLRRPVIHATFNLENDVGLSNYLTANIELDQVVKESSIENLSIVCSGPISPNPSEILGSDRMRILFKEAVDKYDRIIIDCPPLTGIGDGFVVGGLVGHLILVISAGKTPADLIRHIQQQLDKMSIKLLGTVLNRMDLSKERYGGYTKHYYSTYNKYYKRSS